MPCLDFTPCEVMCTALVLCCWNFWQDESPWIGQFSQSSLSMTTYTNLSSKQQVPTRLCTSSTWKFNDPPVTDHSRIANLLEFITWVFNILQVMNSSTERLVYCNGLCLFFLPYAAQGNELSSRLWGGLLPSYMTLMHWLKWWILHWRASIQQSLCHGLQIWLPYVYR
jgi:hypothetical protein